MFEVTEIQLKLALFINYLMSAYNVPICFIGIREVTEKITGKKPCPFEASILVIKNKLINIWWTKEGSALLSHTTGVLVSYFCVINNHTNLSDMWQQAFI